MAEDQEKNLSLCIENKGQLNIAFDNSCIMAHQNNAAESDEDVKNVIIDRAKDIEKYFVKTHAYQDALSKLKSNNIIMLVGKSGYGKSESSIMLAMEYIKDYSIKIIEGTDFGKTEICNEIKTLKNNYLKKELILFDDFLGKTRLNKEEGYLDIINDFIDCFINNSNKKLILNSRKTIVEDAKTHSLSFKSYVDNDIDVIAVDNIENQEEREIIIAQYIQLCNLQDEIEMLFPTPKLFSNVIIHPNFSPLIIKRAFISYRKNRENKLLEMLNHPDEIWENEFRALNDLSKTYLFILFSLSDTWIKQEYVDSAFSYYLKEMKIEYDENKRKTVERLNAFLQFDKYSRITFCHPSIIDYLDKELSESERDKIIEHALYFDQIERLDKKEEYIKQLFVSVKKFFDLKVLPLTFFGCMEHENYIGIKYLDYMLKLNIKVDIDIVLEILRNVFKMEFFLLLYSSDIILDVLLLDYDFGEILNNDDYMLELLRFSNYENIWKIINKISIKSGDTIDFTTLKPYVKSEILLKFNDALSDKLNERIREEFCENLDLYLDEINESEDTFEDDLARFVLDSIMENIDVKSIENEVIEYFCKSMHLDNFVESAKEYETDINSSYEFIAQSIEDFEVKAE